MTYRINSYFAALIITIFGAGASLIIIRVAYNNTFVTTTIDNEAVYTSLQP